MERALRSRTKGTATPTKTPGKTRASNNGNEIDNKIDTEVVYEFGGPIGVTFMVFTCF